METLLVALTLVVMAGVLVLSLIPCIPGPVLMWLVALGFGVLDDFDRLPLFVLAGMTGVMLLGSTTDLWTPRLGIRSDGVLCLGIVGTFMIPVPICSTVLGAVALIFLLFLGSLYFTS